METYKYAPFYAGQEVVAVDAVPGSRFKNGQDYVVSACECKINPANGKGPFWYVGIVGHANGDAWFRPAIFAPKISAAQFIEYEKVEISVN